MRLLSKITLDYLSFSCSWTENPKLVDQREDFWKIGDSEKAGIRFLYLINISDQYNPILKN